MDENVGDFSAFLHGQNGCTATDVEHDLVLKQVLVLHDRVHVGFCADLVLEHLLVDAMVVIAV